MTKCAWCNVQMLKEGEKKPQPGDVRTCDECGGRNSFASVPFDMDSDGIVTSMIPTKWAGINEGVPFDKMPTFWKTAEQGQRELNNLLAGRKKR